MFSIEFRISNGVRQGAVLSPILYCIYMNDLFEILRNSRSGCKVANLLAGAFEYADDLLLRSPPGQDSRICSTSQKSMLKTTRSNNIPLLIFLSRLPLEVVFI
jgi:hypothetical protein